MLGNREVQFAHEEQADTAAAAARLEKLRADSREGAVELPKASRLIARMYAVVQEQLEQAVAVRTRGVGGKFKGWLRAIPADLASVIAIRECISALSGHEQAMTIQTLASNIGKLWELEVRIREAETVNPVYMQRVHDQVRENCTTSQAHLRKLYNVAYTRVMKGELDSRMTQGELIQLGKFGVQACLDAGLLETKRGTASRGTLVQFELSPEIAEFLTDYTDLDVRNIIDREAGAMLCPPDDWTNIGDGGYLTPRRKVNAPLLGLRSIRNSEKRMVRESFTDEGMPLVFEAGNYMQSQAFSLHGPTLKAIQRVWASGGAVLGVPSRKGPQKPVCPFPEEWGKADAPEEELSRFAKWKRAALAYYTEQRAWRGKVREVGGFLKVTAKAGDGPVWFPMYLDKRGRWYYRGSPNPQGSDMSKAVIHYTKKKALGVRGLFWLKVLVANSAGFDKERFVDRAAWTDANWESIKRALDRPEDTPDVWGTDAPWVMYSAAWELNAALSTSNPYAYETGICVHMDATCSGLQHFSALLRDPIGAQYVNLTDEAKCGPKQDIYAVVANNAMRAMQLDLESTEPVVVQMATWWLATGITRTMAKKPVMTFVYGATLKGTADFIREYIEAELKLEWPEEKTSFLYSQYAAKKLFQGIAATCPSAEYAMNWLRDVTRAMPRGKRMTWRTPTGFLVQHDYQAYKETKVFIRSCGLQSILVRDMIDDTRPLRMQNAIAPNFVHALDASHLTLTALKMKAHGLALVGIHDSFGTHACDVDALHSNTREAFYDLYNNRNLMGEFLWEVGGIGEAPMRGSLDLTQVLDSEFFFC